MKNFKELSKEQMSAVKGGGVLMEIGNDEGGHYHIYDNGSSCVKVYVDHDEFPPIR